MYVSLLAGAMDRWDSELDDDALLEHVRACRDALPAYELGAGTYSAAVLAVEVAYDRALVCLAARRGIDVRPTNFAHPKIERDRLELELVRLGVDLRVPSRPPPGGTDVPSPGS